MKVKMELLTDTIFGNGTSIPGAEDISVQCDSQGFPFYKAGTFKGIFREEFENYLFVCGMNEKEIAKETGDLFGEAGEDMASDRKLVFTDFTISNGVKEKVIEEIGGSDPVRITELFTHTRTFTKIGDDGIVSEGSLRRARCIDKGIFFYGEIKCMDEDRKLIEDGLGFVKSVGSLRNRGFGRVKISAITEG